MKLKQTIIIIVLLFAAISTTTTLKAQVTIGSGLKPVAGALLDLKETETAGTENATKGLLLPRVRLSDLNKLYPMFTGTYDPAQDEKHTGLTVYNMNKCLTVSPGKGGTGIYVWSGTEWESMGIPKNVPSANLEFLSSLYGTTDANGNLRIDIPSGLDNRGVTISPFDLTVIFNSQASLATVTNTYNSGVIFSSPGMWRPHTLTTNPTLYNGLQATDMSYGTDPVTAADPWSTRQKVLTFKASGTCQPLLVNKTVTLNQTNYAILAYYSLSGAITAASDSVVLRGMGDGTFRIKSNVGWKATITDPKNIMNHTISATGGTDNSENGSSQTDYTLTSTNTPLTKYETATILLEDNTVPKRAKDLTVTVMQCLGMPDMSGVTTNASNDETSQATAPASWAGKVVRHAAKTGVYEEFYSAEFGVAGRWMTTNLAAWSYDSNISTAVLPTSPEASHSFDPLWCYPNRITNEVADTDYINNPHLGLLYNWYAATAEQNTSHVDQGQGMPDEGPAIPIQGICPNGWHLPSDREWSDLENEIIRNTTRYADVTSNISPDGITGLLPYVNNSYYKRGTAHGYAMMDVCGVNNSYLTEGVSNCVVKNGFAVLPAGKVHIGMSTSQFFDHEAYFWSSSADGYTGAKFRCFLKNGGPVTRAAASSVLMYSIRCKKD